jgi:hypothetical protein
VKPEADTLLTVPDDPPEAGPDLALEAPPLDPLFAGDGEADVAVAKDVPQAAVSPITAAITAAAMIHRRLLFGTDRGRDVALGIGRGRTVSWGFVGS